MPLKQSPLLILATKKRIKNDARSTKPQKFLFIHATEVVKNNETECVSLVNLFVLPGVSFVIVVVFFGLTIRSRRYKSPPASTDTL